MSKRQLLIILSVWTAVFLFLGFPYVWAEILAVITGIIIFILAYGLKSDSNSKPEIKENLSYIEHHVESAPKPTEDEQLLQTNTLSNIQKTPDISNSNPSNTQ